MICALYCFLCLPLINAERKMSNIHTQNPQGQ